MKKFKDYVSKFSKNIKKEINNFILKYDHIYIPIISKTVYFIVLISFTILLLDSLQKMNIIEVSKDNLISLKKIKYINKFNDLFILQVSITFLITTLLSLISSIENKLIYGEKASTIIFGKNHVRLQLPIFLIYVFMIINLIFMLNENNANLFLILFISSIMLLIYIITKIGNVFITTKRQKAILLAKYYKESRYNILNNIPPRDYKSPLLSNLKEETISLIINKNMESIRYMSIYKYLINKTLNNLPKEIQKYHLNMEYAPSIIKDYLELIEHYLYIGDDIRAIQNYYWLLEKLNYFKVYIFSYQQEKVFETIVNKLSAFENQFQAIEYLSRISGLISNIELQQDYAFKNDFTYTNISNQRLNHISFQKSNFFELLYIKINDNKYLSNKEKQICYHELYDIFRMSSFLAVFFHYNNYIIDNNSEIPKKRQLEPCIVGEATSLLLLRTLCNKDIYAFNLFANMNIKNEEFSFSIHTLILSLIKIELENQNKNIYCDFYGIDITWCKKFIKDKIAAIFTSNRFILEKIKEDYSYIMKICKTSINEEKNFSIFGNFISKYDLEIIDLYFEKIFEEYNIDFTPKVNKKAKISKIIKKYI